jgi:hypothetical protein
MILFNQKQYFDFDFFYIVYLVTSIFLIVLTLNIELMNLQNYSKFKWWYTSSPNIFTYSWIYTFISFSAGFGHLYFSAAAVTASSVTYPLVN